MPEPLKYRYNQAFMDGAMDALEHVIQGLDREAFAAQVLAEGWDTLELKQRAHRYAQVLRRFLDPDWSRAAVQLTRLVPVLHDQHPGLELEYMFLPEVVSEFGLDDVDASFKAMEALTQYTTSEFAVRPFIVQDLEGAMARMQAYSEHKHYGVRRWSSEGCRPLLPWGMVLQDLKADPAPILPILDRLKNDPSDFVRRSVANNLNDISKNQPELVVDLTKQWRGRRPQTDALLKHANRTLLKAGHPEVMELFGFAPVSDLKVEGFEVLTPEVPFEGALEFKVDITNPRPEPVLLRIEYAMHYLRANGTLSRKVFKVSERNLAPGTHSVVRQQSFKPISTRRYYPGEQAVSLVLNGVDVARAAFELLPQDHN